METNKSILGNPVKAKTASVVVSKSPEPSPGKTMADGWKNLEEKISSNRELCIFIYETRKAMKTKPKLDADYVKAFLDSMQKDHPQYNELRRKLETASKLNSVGNNYQYKITQKRVPKEAWTGTFDIKKEEYVPRKPESHAPSWWRSLGIDINADKPPSASKVADSISGESYCSAYAKSGTLQELIQELWFVGKTGADVRKVISKCHDDLNEWCERNDMERVPPLRDRQSYLSQGQTARFLKKNNARGFLVKKTQSASS